MSKMVLILTLLFIAFVFLTGQTKEKEMQNYGYKLMPLSQLEVVKNFPNKYYRSETSLTKTNTLPLSVDYSSLMPPVVDQGGQGSCVAFSYTYGLAYLNNL